MFSHLKIPSVVLCLIQLGLCSMGLKTSAFHIYVVVMSDGGKTSFGTFAMRKLCDFYSRTITRKKTKTDNQLISVTCSYLASSWTFMR